MPAIAVLLSTLLVPTGCGTRESPTTISASELAGELDAEGAPIILDVRTPGEFESGHVPGAVNVPHPELESRLSELDATRTVVVYCESGRRADIAESVLRENGFRDVRHLDGDMRAWRAAGLPCQGC